MHRKIITTASIMCVLFVCLSLLSSADSLSEKSKWPTAEYDVHLLSEDEIKQLGPPPKKTADTKFYFVINGTGEERILDSSIIRRKRPVLTLKNDARAQKIETYDCSGIMEIKKLCPECNKRMMTVSVLHEGNPRCGHGIFSYANYCVKDDVYIPFVFFDRCGCNLPA